MKVDFQEFLLDFARTLEDTFILGFLIIYEVPPRENLEVFGFVI